MGEDEMQQGFVVGGFLFPSHENASVAIEPRGDSLDNPATRALAINSFVAVFLESTLAVRSIAAPMQSLSKGFVVVAHVAAQILWGAGARSRNRNAVERLE